MEFLSVPEVLKLIPWKRRTLYAHIRRRTFVQPARCGRKLLFDSAEVHAWIAARFAERDQSQQADAA